MGYLIVVRTTNDAVIGRIPDDIHNSDPAFLRKRIRDLITKVEYTGKRVPRGEFHLALPDSTKQLFPFNLVG